MADRQHLRRGPLPQLLAAEYTRFRPSVLSYLESLFPAEPCVVLDPMAGTAPLVPTVQLRGDTGHFVDMLPVHYHVNLARTYESCLALRELGRGQLITLLTTCSRHLRSVVRRCRVSDQWIEDQTLHGLLAAWEKTSECERPLTDLLRACILLTVRGVATYSTTKNPTWLRPGGMARGLQLRDALADVVDRLVSYHEAAYECEPKSRPGKAVLSTGDAAHVAVKGGVDLIVASPAYCNRLDYRRMYGPELHLLRQLGEHVEERQLLGNPSVRDYAQWTEDRDRVCDRSDTAAQFLRLVAERQIRSERTSNYYVKTFTRYFAKLLSVFDNLVGVLRKHGVLAVVTQDNTHRGLPINTHEVLVEFLSSAGLRVSTGRTWERHHLGKRNVSRAYPAVSHKHVERVLVARR